MTKITVLIYTGANEALRYGRKHQKKGGGNTENFEILLRECRGAVERFIRFRLRSDADADDIIQETFISAYRAFGNLRDKSTFKAWILRIASNKLNDYFREKAKNMEIPLESTPQTRLSRGRCGVTEISAVAETLGKLADKDRRILYLYYYQGYSQDEIARLIGIKPGTVKSRMYAAKARFKERYPYPPEVMKGENNMKKLPQLMPEYTIRSSDEKPFEVKCEELPGWFIIPREGEKCVWGSYDFPERRLTETVTSAVTGKIELHGVTGVEIRSDFTEIGEDFKDNTKPEHYYYAQLTQTHCRWLGESYTGADGVKHILTFLDGDEFIEEWGIGEDNRGAEISMTSHGTVTVENGIYTSAEGKRIYDIVGRYTLTMGSKTYDTVMHMEEYKNGALTETYIGADGRTVLWRRFNRDDWAFDRYKQKWSDRLPSNERITVNGEIYVHWYDCITDKIM